MDLPKIVAIGRTIAGYTFVALVAGAAIVGLASTGARIWAEPTSPMPAWIQAVGSIGAILASWYFISIDHKKQRETAQEAEKTELANLVLATYMLGAGVSSVVQTFVSSGGQKGHMPMSGIDFCISRIKRVIEQHSRTPHWKMDLQAALNWSVVNRLATAIEGSLVIVKQESGESSTAITLGVSDSSLNWQRGLARTMNEAAEQYKKLTGTEIPQHL